MPRCLGSLPCQIHMYNWCILHSPAKHPYPPSRTRALPSRVVSFRLQASDCSRASQSRAPAFPPLLQHIKKKRRSDRSAQGRTRKAPATQHAAATVAPRAQGTRPGLDFGQKTPGGRHRSSPRPCRIARLSSIVHRPAHARPHTGQNPEFLNTPRSLSRVQSGCR